MRVPPFERYGRFLQMAGIFGIGIIVGAIVFNSLYHYQLNALYSTLNEQGSIIEEKEQDIRQLTEFKDQHTVIKTIHVYIESDRGSTSSGSGLDTQTVNELKRVIREDLEVFIGRSVYKIGPDAKLARMLLDQKIYTRILDKDYSITVRTMLIIGTTLDIYVEAKVHENV